MGVVLPLHFDRALITLMYCEVVYSSPLHCFSGLWCSFVSDIEFEQQFGLVCAVYFLAKNHVPIFTMMINSMMQHHLVTFFNFVCQAYSCFDRVPAYLPYWACPFIPGLSREHDPCRFYWLVDQASGSFLFRLSTHGDWVSLRWITCCNFVELFLFRESMAKACTIWLAQHAAPVLKHIIAAVCMVAITL